MIIMIMAVVRGVSHNPGKVQPFLGEEGGAHFNLHLKVQLIMKPDLRRKHAKNLIVLKDQYDFEKSQMET